MKENYLMLNGQKIQLTEDKLEKIKPMLPDREKRLGDFEPGDAFKIGEHEFFVLEQYPNATAVLYKGLLEKSMKFGENNNFADDSCVVRERLDDLSSELANLAGAENLIEHNVDLTSDDGLDDYGTTTAKVSLLTASQYREYVRIIDEHKIDKWWWLVTPYSTPTHEDADWIKCVSPRGHFDGGIYCGDRGVRPFCILNSNIFVSV